MNRLYELSKDMLVKLMETVDKDTKEKYEKEIQYYKDRFEMCEYLGRFDIYTCFQDKQGCLSLRVSGDRDDTHKYCEKNGFM